MSLTAAASSAAVGSTVITVTVGTDATSYGYDVTTPFGSRSPTLLYGSTIRQLTCNPGVTSTQVSVAGIVAATFFTNVSFYFGASGATLTNKTAASATFSTSGGNSFWTWSTTTTFTATDNGLARFVIFYR